ncbi:hypothetical protein AZO1586I_820 [Bathymodiolus thermophilus thioautotrophic gill symbiont]|uniref:Uncharacterized protein n=2 Tax=sulfur-oxidizing symbionts TaxID=32036 RepID=A0ACA8ZRX2_9GAMM|nr:hypothetical protein AZO1586I_820 [Bathymodiolus thermophilus thioautotrophic gill symbiont]CAB5504872.1 hypothetical protein AZO1586R_1824 [Bathymodiolus azoricus thioautotrophic gill symbiont]CAC9505512.1 hypothetical protein [uncultured Gammaproteobacteria bacterium]CAC9512618.1 hypothetical protein [uncultured Gammaproteobacteria bacterium]CAC9533276.1 hypothetical protein [uncultured Gammaproteobacteria bacterium]
MNSSLIKEKVKKVNNKNKEKVSNKKYPYKALFKRVFRN